MPFLTGNLFLCCAFFGLSPRNDKRPLSLSLSLSPFVLSRIPEWRNKNSCYCPRRSEGVKSPPPPTGTKGGGIISYPPPIPSLPALLPLPISLLPSRTAKTPSKLLPPPCHSFECNFVRGSGRARN